MKNSHRLSGILIAIFVAFHLANHATSLLGSQYHIDVTRSLRVVYRNPVVETLLVLAVGWQIISGVTLFFRQVTPTRWGMAFWQRWSGLYLAFFFLIHLSAVATGRYIAGLDTNLYFGAAGLNTFPHLLFFVPYYGLAILAFFVHAAIAHQKHMTKTVLGLRPNQQGQLLIGVGTLLTMLILYGLTNGFRGLAIPAGYSLTN